MLNVSDSRETGETLYQDSTWTVSALIRSYTLGAYKYELIDALSRWVEKLAVDDYSIAVQMESHVNRSPRRATVCVPVFPDRHVIPQVSHIQTAALPNTVSGGENRPDCFREYLGVDSR